MSLYLQSGSHSLLWINECLTVQPVAAFLLLCFVANISTLPALATNTETFSAGLRDNESEYIFVGRCSNGETYRLISYEIEIDGLLQSFYDYEGPAGKGTVRSEIAPKKMVVRVCHEQADIRHGSTFD